jgi:caspase domain-containing protein
MPSLIGTGSIIEMRLPFWLCLMAVSAIMTSPVWSEQQAARVALVIGNANYPDASTPLSTTIKDARTLAEKFHRTGFAVDLKENVGKADTRASKPR